MRTLPLVILATLALNACKKTEARPPAQDMNPPAPPMAIAEFGGRIFNLQAQRDTVVVMFFGFTQCPDFCPTTMADFATVHRQLGERAGRVKFVFFSVDHVRDTPELAQKYAHRFHPSFIGLTADSAGVERVLGAFGGQMFITRGEHGDMQVAHSAEVIVFGPDGRRAGSVLQGAGRVEWLYNIISSSLGS